MSIHNWLDCFRSALSPGDGPHKTPRRDAQRSMFYRLCVESLEDRRMLSFVPAASHSAGTNPYAIATADFNNDGNLDLAATVGIASNSRVSVRLGDGAGGFVPAQEFAVPGYDTPSSLFIADLNNDTRPDMVVSEFNSFSTLIGNGDGTFQPAVSTSGVSMVAAGHFYHDSNVIGLVTWLDGDWATHVQVYFGNGQGGFFSFGYDAHYWGNGGGMAAVDLNQDGTLDVVTGEGVVFLGSINGTLQLNYEQQAPLTGGAVATGDFTGDGNVDVIVAGTGVALLPSRGDGSLEAPIHYSVNGSHSSVGTGDFNSDGKLDAIVTDSNAGSVNVMLGNGDGTLRYAGTFVTGRSPSGLTIGDFNRDGRPDVAVANRDSNNLTVLLNDGNWTTLPPAPPTISISDATVIEGNSGTVAAAFTVSLSVASNETITVDYATGNGTATSGSDYQLASGTLTIPAGQTTGTITVLVNADFTPEPDETFHVSLGNTVGATIADGQGVGKIVNDDVALPSLSVGDLSKQEGKSGTTTFSFVVTLSAPSSVPVTVQYATADGTATVGGRDYYSKSGTLTFQPGQTSKTVTVSVRGDRTREAHETFFLNLANSQGATIGDGQGVGTVLNDDGGMLAAVINEVALSQFGRKRR